MTGWLSDFETETATFFAYEIVGEVEDPYDPDDGTTDEYDWTGAAIVDVRFEPAGQGYQRQESGETVRRAPRVFAPPSLLDTDAYAVEHAEELEGEAFALGDTVTEPTHRIVTCHHDRLDAADDGVLRMEMEGFSGE